MLNFKNYFNREIEVCGTHAEDYTRLYGYINVINNMSLWNPNDGVNTVITTCWNVNTIPNYVLVCPDGDDEIQSRWWVIKHERIAGTQYRLYLRRDLIADNLDLVLNSEHSYIARGWCPDTTDLIYNSENITCNQIKKSQLTLTDSTYSPWIYIYIKCPSVSDITTTAGDTYKVLDFSGLQGSRRCLINGTDIRFWSYYKEYFDNTGTYPYKDRDCAISISHETEYIVFTLPYADFLYRDSKDVLHEYTKEDALNFISKYVQIYGDWVLDVQLLPYCALTTQSLLNLKPYLDYDHYKSSGAILVNEFSANTELLAIPQVTQMKWSDVVLYNGYNRASITVDDLKIDKNLRTYRLVSPNGNGVFEFNAADLVNSANSIVEFRADFTILPYQPYINIKPLMNRLYGGNYRDYRGLICSGDYSLPRNTSAWTEYVNNNKNYQASFDRQIATMKVEHKAEQAQEAANILSSAISSSVSGAVGGAMVGGGVGAIVGGAVSGASSLAAGMVSQYHNAELRKIELENTITYHNMQMDNIKASPTTVTGIGAFNTDNTLFPLLEIYQGSDSDFDRFNKYIEENGYNISTYGKLINYMSANGTFYSIMFDRLWYFVTNDDGTVSKVEFVGDSNMLQELCNECSRGFYYQYF